MVWRPAPEPGGRVNCVLVLEQVRRSFFLCVLRKYMTNGLPVGRSRSQTPLSASHEYQGTPRPAPYTRRYRLHSSATFGVGNAQPLSRRGPRTLRAHVRLSGGQPDEMDLRGDERGIALAQDRLAAAGRADAQARGERADWFRRDALSLDRAPSGRHAAGEPAGDQDRARDAGCEHPFRDANRCQRDAVERAGHVAGRRHRGADDEH